MTTPSCINLEQTTAAIEWQWNGATRTLVIPDPTNSTIRFTARLDITQHRALFEIVIPIRFKDKGTASAIYLRMSPLFINSFDFSTKTEPPETLKTTFDSVTTSLDLQLTKTVAVLVPIYVKEPVSAARPRSGKVLDSLCELSRVTALRVYIRDSLLSDDQLRSIRDEVHQRNLEPFSGPDYDISRMFAGNGAKATVLAPVAPPSYEKSTSLQPAPSYERKRPRQNTIEGPKYNVDEMWKRLCMLESTIAEIREPRAESTKPRDEKQELRDPQAQAENAEPVDQSQMVQKLSAENSQLRDRVSCLESKLAALVDKHESLEREIAGLRDSQDATNYEEDAAVISIREDIKALEDRADYIERGKDDDDFAKKLKEEVFHELAARVSAG
ncbi:hypothetical protein FSARC_12311 [Fusarium sarcochroum]|uniref:Uncharacterized protein n=1 Tax=Fusarium sarcochroum TaxID=1208366 RepID=A0A8H4T9F8_9HYPO|nr:hypothetical protein FSARC_12311 [Fusarium sarcochroum]